MHQMSHGEEWGKGSIIHPADATINFQGVPLGVKSSNWGKGHPRYPETNTSLHKLFPKNQILQDTAEAPKDQK